jgi:hypothetical protein
MSTKFNTTKCKTTKVQVAIPELRGLVRPASPLNSRKPRCYGFTSRTWKLETASHGNGLLPAGRTGRLGEEKHSHGENVQLTIGLLLLPFFSSSPQGATIPDARYGRKNARWKTWCKAKQAVPLPIDRGMPAPQQPC